MIIIIILNILSFSRCTASGIIIMFADVDDVKGIPIQFSIYLSGDEHQTIN